MARRCPKLGAAQGCTLAYAGILIHTPLVHQFSHRLHRNLDRRSARIAPEGPVCTRGALESKLESGSISERKLWDALLAKSMYTVILILVALVAMS